MRGYMGDSYEMLTHAIVGFPRHIKKGIALLSHGLYVAQYTFCDIHRKEASRIARRAYRQADTHQTNEALRAKLNAMEHQLGYSQ